MAPKCLLGSARRKRRERKKLCTAKRRSDGEMHLSLGLNAVVTLNLNVKTRLVTMVNLSLGPNAVTVKMSLGPKAVTVKLSVGLKAVTVNMT